jgi:hypothetical protein
MPLADAMSVLHQAATPAIRVSTTSPVYISSPQSFSPIAIRRPTSAHASAGALARTGGCGHNPHSRARHPAGSLNPASMRSRSCPASPLVPRDLTEASRFPRERKCDSLFGPQGVGAAMVWRLGQSDPKDLRARVLTAVDGGMAARAAASFSGSACRPSTRRWSHVGAPAK